jgi:hypothetical protein
MVRPDQPRRRRWRTWLIVAAGAVCAVLVATVTAAAWFYSLAAPAEHLLTWHQATHRTPTASAPR